MISSAVVIPESVALDNGSPNLKRKQSSVEPDDVNKKPRIEPEGTNGDFQNGTTSHSKEPISPISPPPRRSSILATKDGASEEKKRGRRLFGSLLGTLSQANAKPAHKKRDEIEARQRERLRKDDEEREKQQRQKKMELDRRRRSEQKEWAREGTEIRHRNMRATARFLQTKTEPRLFYMPWELRAEEQERISRQKDDVEEVIRRELAATGDEMGVSGAMEDVRNSSPREDSQRETATELDSESIRKDSGPQSPDERPNEPRAEPEAMQTDEAEAESGKKTEETAQEDKTAQDEHHGEELVEGQEDDVIY